MTTGSFTYLKQKALSSHSTTSFIRGLFLSLGGRRRLYLGHLRQFFALVWETGDATGVGAEAGAGGDMREFGLAYSADCEKDKNKRRGDNNSNNNDDQTMRRPQEFAR